MDMKTFGILEKYCEKEGLKMAVPIQTNEEYLRSCNTEQLAEKLWEIYYAGKLDAKTYDAFEYFIDKEDVVDWLKQPHTSKE